MAKWKSPNSPTGPARQIWAALFPGETWPKGWRVEWVGFMRGAAGLTIYTERRVLLSYGDAKARNAEMKGWGAVDTLLHEFVHMRCGKSLRHGKEFMALENGLRIRLGLMEKGT